MKRALIITATGEKIETDLDPNSYEVLSGAVGGLIECVQLNPKLNLWVNEEGKLTGLPYNSVATRLWEAVFGFGTGVIVGDAILTGGTDSEGDTLGLDETTLKLIDKLTPEFVNW